ncbi:hypothetical protein DFH09DRAFT_1359304 [Mycena vulgaris]|nr:hypothetical protein DFH09DRAFT_1359304 [Mycena vulgaris]
MNATAERGIFSMHCTRSGTQGDPSQKTTKKNTSPPRQEADGEAVEFDPRITTHGTIADTFRIFTKGTPRNLQGRAPRTQRAPDLNAENTTVYTDGSALRNGQEDAQLLLRRLTLSPPLGTATTSKPPRLLQSLAQCDRSRSLRLSVDRAPSAVSFSLLHATSNLTSTRPVARAIPRRVLRASVLPSSYFFLPKSPYSLFLSSSFLSLNASYASYHSTSAFSASGTNKKWWSLDGTKGTTTHTTLCAALPINFDDHARLLSLFLDAPAAPFGVRRHAATNGGVRGLTLARRPRRCAFALPSVFGAQLVARARCVIVRVCVVVVEPLARQGARTREAGNESAGKPPLYHETIKMLYTSPQSVGIAGSRPSRSYYFVGVQGNGLFYLDPHHSRPVGRLLSPEASMNPDYGHGQRQGHTSMTEDELPSMRGLRPPSEFRLACDSRLADIRGGRCAAPTRRFSDPSDPAPLDRRSILSAPAPGGGALPFSAFGAVERRVFFSSFLLHV